MIRVLLDQSACSIICLQESKLVACSVADWLEILGPRFDMHVALDANGTRGWIILGWRSDRFTAARIKTQEFSIMACLTPMDGGDHWSLTTVYGPHDEARKPAFLAELAQIHNSLHGPWLLIGDFNLIKDPQDKNNNWICRRWMNRFRRTLNRSSLHEIPLIGRKYTWSNEKQVPTLVHLDRAFCNVEWELLFSAAKLLPLASAISDHCPLMLVNEGILAINHRFCFESYWQFVTSFKEVVQQAWAEGTGGRCPVSRLSTKLWRTSKALSNWSRTHVGDLQK